MAGGGNLMGTRSMHDGDEVDDNESTHILPSVSAASDQGGRPGKRQRVLKPEPPLSPGVIRPMSVEPMQPQQFTTIANHPQAGPQHDEDFSAMVEQLVARYVEKFPEEEVGAVRQVVEAIAEIAQPQQMAQVYRQVVKPRETQRGIEASGYFLFGDNEDGSRVGIVESYERATASSGAKFYVKYVGGDFDGSYASVGIAEGVYRAAGPYPVLALANPSTSHGKIPADEMRRLKAQNLGMSREVIEMLVEGELRKVKWDRTAKPEPQAAIPTDEEIQAYAGELVQRYERGTANFVTGTTTSRWVNYGCGRRWTRVPAQYQRIILTKLRTFMTQQREGRVHPVPQEEVPEEKSAEPPADDIPGPVEAPKGEPPSDISSYVALDTTNVALGISLVIVVALLVFSD